MVQPNGHEPWQVDEFGALLRDWRQQAGLTQEQLAERSGLSTRTIRALERGQARPRPGTLQLLGDGLGLDGPARARFRVLARQPRLAAEAAPPASAARPPAVVLPAQLPADVAGFTGRDQHLRQLDALLAEAGAGQDGRRGQAVVISAIAGTAGVGKTALAIHWAHRVRERFPDGQLYVNLHGYAHDLPLSPLQALAQLLGALGVEADKIPVEADQAAGLYRSLLADRRVLVVLDNARDAEQVRPLVPGAAGCLVVVTSRDLLGGLVASHGAHRLDLDALSLQEAVRLLARILGEDRVGAEPQATRELAQACGLLPLALRIAAANLSGQPDRPIAGWLARLRGGDPLAELAVDGDPHATVGAAFDCSYTVLDPDARRLFRLLGLVPGPEFTPEAASALAGVPVGRAGQVLQRLAGAHLVEPRALGRYGVHDLLRLYARQRAERDDTAAARRHARNQLLGWYLHTADAAAGLLYPQMLRLPLPTADPGVPPAGFAGRADALGWLDAEQVNLVAAIQHAATHGQRPLAWLLADALRGWLWDRRHLVDWLMIANAALGAAQAEGDPHAQAAAHRNLGMVCQCLGDRSAAAEHYTIALALAHQAGCVDGEASVLADFGLLHFELGHLRQAADHLTQSLALARQTGRKAGQATALNSLGIVCWQMGRLEQAVEHATEALALHRETGARSGQAATLSTLGEVLCDLGRLDEAREHLRQALALAREMGSRYDEAEGLNALAAVERDAGQLSAALELAEAAVALALEIDDPRIQANALNTLGRVHLSLDSEQQAIEHHRTALGLARRTGVRYAEADALLGLAAACQQQGRHSPAIQHAEQARILAREAGFRILEGRAHAILAAVHLDLHQCDEAARHAKRALAIFREAGHRLGYARALVTLATPSTAPGTLPPAGRPSRRPAPYWGDTGSRRRPS